MISTTLDPQGFDVILISGDYWADHPHSGVGVIARVLEHSGYSVGIIEKPNWENIADFTRLGLPRLFFGITSGAVDSMLVNYTPLKKSRASDPHNSYQSGIPDRAVIVYVQRTREAINNMLGKKKTTTIPIVLGGVEASLRRFSHYDYWDNSVRKSILIDAKADILIYGPGEYQVVELANRLKNKQDVAGIEGTCILSKEVPPSFEILPSHTEVTGDPRKFCEMTVKLTNWKNLAQQVDHRYLLQYKMHAYTPAELDAIFNLPFSYQIPETFKEFEMAQFSVMLHRGCIGRCNFCSIALHQGDRIVSRSEKNIQNEIHRLSQLKTFKGTISDLGGPSANMYGMDCAHPCNNPNKNCLSCPNLDRSHQRITALMKIVGTLPQIKHSFVTSGIRYDLAVDCDSYLQELANHISGTLKIAPEHFSPSVLSLMNKNNDRFEEFLTKFERYNHHTGHTLRYYFMTAHPGSSMKEVEFLKHKMKELKLENIENVQVFTPTPMSISTCMYYTGLNPFTLEPVYVPYSYREKKDQKNRLFDK
jgi:uncharacterized radical SAM protein YgiQ